MHLLTLGLNHQTAPIEIRERAAFGPESIQQALADLTQSVGASEAAILSTCNRTEIYCGQENDNRDKVFAWLSEHSGLGPEELRKSIYHYPNAAAVRHAFRVASGLDSMVLGEPQILGQMKEAFHTASSVGATGKVLNRLFQHTFSVAKQVRTDTAIGENAVSVAYTGVNLAKRIFTSLSNQSVLLIGAGETIELVARHLKQNQVRHIVIANRSIDKARTLAKEVGCEAITLAQIPDRLHQADIVVTSTASTLPILGKGAIEAALKTRRHSPMFILDLAVPRDVEPEVSQLKDAYLYTVDDLKTLVDENRELRIRAAEEAENIIDFQVVKFMRWMRSLDSVPAIRSFRDGLNNLRQVELERALRKLDKGEDPAAVLEQFARDLTNKVAHQPSQVLRQADIEGNASIISAAKKLFDL
jgi:glutamyl-tRNA reductase